ncbi:lysine transporter LysE [Shewanella algae]|uniref:Threonine efflux protein n=1 Tax=Shewanella algae TaxID=38313 RepID=A0A379YYI4_9GAMM|nr:LysE family translocator [Shewanella algae]AXQ14872.1 lysine transporter LysE [Shewanella algae]MBO2551276.1 LysE family translocator [Shewanella algae]MBO2555536.1 LysE family translocator [Shewanella algae]MBO2572470.1 LysE family translocator [Shewanella algae]MBO2576847.1 LysE family translocator [Shewanella algae]
MNWSDWLGLVAISCLGAMSPGPSLAMVVRHTLGGGRSRGITCAWAHSLGIGVYAFITLLGLAVVLKHTPLLFNGIAILGALYLAWLGVQALQSKGGMQQKLSAGKPTSMLTAARDGIAISLFNPKILLFFLALFSQFVAAADSLLGRGIIVLTPMLVDGLWYTLIAFLLSQPKVLPKLREKAQLIDRLSGLVLILLAGRVIYSLL